MGCGGVLGSCWWGCGPGWGDVVGLIGVWLYLPWLEEGGIEQCLWWVLVK